MTELYLIIRVHGHVGHMPLDYWQSTLTASQRAQTEPLAICPDKETAVMLCKPLIKRERRRKTPNDRAQEITSLAEAFVRKESLRG